MVGNLGKQAVIQGQIEKLLIDRLQNNFDSRRKYKFVNTLLTLVV